MALRCQFSSDSGKNSKRGNGCLVAFIRLFLTSSITPPSAAHWSDTEPIFRSEIENRASVAHFSHFATVTVSAFAESANALLAHRLDVSPFVKRAAYGRVTDSGFKKKLMKTTKTKKIEASAPANVRPSSVSKTGKQPEVKLRELERRFANRQLSTQAILTYLRTRLPKQYEVAEVVGKWIWLESPAKGGIAAVLWLVGFHWNSRRGVWQHPCGRFNPLGSHPTDPRQKYRCYFPADVTPA